MSSVINELADRVERLARPDREADVSIFKMVGAPTPFQFANQIVALSYDESEQCYFAPVGDMRVRYEAPAYTASIDAAITLVPEGVHVSIVGPAGKTHSCRIGDEVGLATSFPLAITAAALRARARTQGNPNG